MHKELNQPDASISVRFRKTSSGAPVVPKDRAPDILVTLVSRRKLRSPSRSDAMSTSLTGLRGDGAFIGDEAGDAMDGKWISSNTRVCSVPTRIELCSYVEIPFERTELSRFAEISFANDEDGISQDGLNSLRTNEHTSKYYPSHHAG